MRLPPISLLSFAATTLLSPLFAAASSTTRNPIGAVASLQNATIHTHNHRITALSDFHLSFNIRDDLHVKFHLEPNHDILPDDAVVSYLAPDGSISHSESVDRLKHKVFKGTAWVRRPRVGHEQWENVGWARIFVVQDGEAPVFEGVFSAHFDAHHIQTSANFLSTRHELDPEIEASPPVSQEYMVMWRDSDVLPNAPRLQQQAELRRGAYAEPSCQADDLNFNLQPDHPVYLGMAKRSAGSFGAMGFSHLFGKRQIDGTTGGNSAGVNLVSTIGQTSGCPSTRKVALVGVATDCTYTAAFSSQQSARENVISQMNQASGVWENAFNISLGLQNLTISDPSCPGTPAESTKWNQACSSGVQISDRLNLFSAWRGTLNDSNSHWTLLSTCNTGSAVGLAWLGQACVQTAMTTNGTGTTGNGQSSGSDSETVSGANVVVRTQGASEWQVIAHETGHTYGAVHDCTSQTCADANTVNSQQCCPLSASTCDAGAQYIMNPSTGQGINHFSPCSIGNICSAIGRNSVKTTCLSNNKQVTTISGQQCGNGIVEPGEDCDCGGTAGCSGNTCCDPTTCKFTSGSVCDDSNEDCCHSCQLATNGTICRASTGVCDPQETCSGTSPNCPADQLAPNGQGCGDGLQCASGTCTSRDQQCKTVMGSYTQGNDTYACDSNDCQISCASPEFGSGVCYGLQQNFLDGTACGGGGTCQNGQCQGTNFGGQVSSWINDHKDIVIGVACAVGGLLLLSILGCLVRCCKRKRPNKRVNGPQPVPPPGGWQGWNNGSARGGQPQMQQQRGPQNPYYTPQHPSQGWSDRNQTPGHQPPPAPPQAYLGRGVRYA